MLSADVVRAIAAGSLLAATGCQGFTHLEFEPLTEAPSGTVLAYEGIRVVDGRAIGFVAIPMSGNDQMDEDSVLELSSENPAVAGVGPSLDPWSFVMFGVAPGETALSVRLDGEHVGSAPVRVEVQP